MEGDVWSADKIIHGYFSINWVIVWDVISNELVDLKTQITGLLKT